MDWLIVGAGDIARKRVLPALLADRRCRVAAVCAVHRDRARAFAPAGAEVFTDYGRALAHPGIEAVYICTPVFLHVPQAIAALEAGKHVLVEKPMGRDLADAERLVEAARRSGRTCGVAYYRRLSARYAHLKKVLTEHTLGQIVLVRMCCCSWFDPAPDDPKSWRVVPEKGGGGPVADVGVHMFDLLADLFGLPEAVSARVATLTHRYAVEDSAAVTLRLRNGTLVTASFHWNTRAWQHEFEVIGSEGRIAWRPFDSGPVMLTLGRETTTIALPEAENVHAPLIADFVTAVSEGRRPACPAEDGLAANRIMDAAYRSARTGAEVLLQGSP